MMNIDKEVSKMYNRHLDDIFSGSRKGKLPEARFLIWYLHNAVNNKSSLQLESIYGWDDSTIRFGIMKTKDRIKLYPSFRERVLSLEYQLKNN